MATERAGLMQVGGKDVTIIGDDLRVGDVAPEFTAHAQDWSLRSGLGDTDGKVRIITSLPSLSTSVCDRETKHFNEAASSLGDDIVIEAVSTDLPYTQKNWCAASGVDKVVTLSDHMAVEFGEKYGALIKERRILRRAVFVVGKDNKLTYVAYLPALGDEPNYDEVLEAARKALG